MGEVLRARTRALLIASAVMATVLVMATISSVGANASSTQPSVATGAKPFADLGGDVGILSTSACPDGEVCFWRHSGFEGAAVKVDGGLACCVWRYITGPGEWFRSAKNRTTGRKLELGTSLNVIACINPGGERRDPGIFDRARVGQVGSRC